MKNKINIYLNKIDDVKKFANVITSFAEPAAITKGEVTYDAKSIMGVLLLGGSTPVTITIMSEDENVLSRFHEALAPFTTES